MVNFYCIFAKEALVVKKYLKDIDNDDVINYMDIANKLTKNDIYSKEPSDVIIGSYIIKYLEKSIVDKENVNIYYVLSCLDPVIINNIKKYVKKLSLNNFKFNAIIKEKECYNEVHSIFDEVFELI